MDATVSFNLSLVVESASGAFQAARRAQSESVLRVPGQSQRLGPPQTPPQTTLRLRRGEFRRT